MEKTIEEIEERLLEIEKRNKFVEKNKLWETSFSRRFIIMIFTYLAIGFYLSAIGIRDSWLHAIVPSIAFVLSTLTLPYFKGLWLRYIYKE